MNTGNQSNLGSGGNTPPPPPNRGEQYYVLIDNKQNGPHNINAIQKMIDQNIVTRQTLIWKKGMTDWGNIMDEKDLKEMVNKIPPPPSNTE